MPVRDIDTKHVLAVLEPIWRIKPETASRTRGRIEAVLDFAKVQGWRTAENVARWRGHLRLILPAVAKVRPVVHLSARLGGIPGSACRPGGAASPRRCCIIFALSPVLPTASGGHCSRGPIGTARRTAFNLNPAVE